MIFHALFPNYAFTKQMFYIINNIYIHIMEITKEQLKEIIKQLSIMIDKEMNDTSLIIRPTIHKLGLTKKFTHMKTMKDSSKIYPVLIEMFKYDNKKSVNELFPEIKPGSLPHKNSAIWTNLGDVTFIKKGFYDEVCRNMGYVEPNVPMDITNKLKNLEEYATDRLKKLEEEIKQLKGEPK